MDDHVGDPSATGEVLLATPQSDHAPEDVVRILLDALQHVDHPHEGAGYEVVYRFVSPDSRRFVGGPTTLERFLAQPLLSPLVGPERWEVDLAHHIGEGAIVEVGVLAADGHSYGYQFRLSKARGGPLDGCWLVDACLPLQE